MYLLNIHSDIFLFSIFKLELLYKNRISYVKARDLPYIFKNYF